MQDENVKVGVISLDNYKVGAFKQLEAYSEVLNLQLEVIEKPNQLIKAFHSLKNMDYIFIDTAGSSPYDLNKISKLDEFLNYHSKLNIEKILVVSANTKYDDAKDTFINFNIIDIDSIIVTKLDETSNYGDIFSFLNFSGIPVRNFGIGQTVPNDFISANSVFLSDLLLKYKKISHKSSNNA
jgi:flagellar biosynthesis protein FlhF